MKKKGIKIRILLINKNYFNLKKKKKFLFKLNSRKNNDTCENFNNLLCA